MKLPKHKIMILVKGNKFGKITNPPYFIKKCLLKKTKQFIEKSAVIFLTIGYKYSDQTKIKKA